MHHAWMNWYFETEGVSHGPVEESALVLMIRRRELPRDSMIWHPGLEEWQSFADLKPEWLIVPGIGGVAEPEPPRETRVRPAPIETPSPTPASPRATLDTGDSEAPPPPPKSRPSQVRTVLPPAPKPKPQPLPEPAAEPEPPPAPEKKGFFKKLFGGGKKG